MKCDVITINKSFMTKKYDSILDCDAKHVIISILFY